MKLIRLILICFALYSVPLAFTQEQEEQGSTLKHMLKKTKSDSLIYAGDQMTPNHFLIQIPDSVYSSSQIEIKKFKLASVGKMNLFLKSNHRHFNKTRYQIKGNRKAERFLNFLLNDLNLSKEQLESGEINMKGKMIRFRYDVSDRYHYFIFTTAVPEAK